MIQVNEDNNYSNLTYENIMNRTCTRIAFKAVSIFPSLNNYNRFKATVFWFLEYIIISKFSQVQTLQKHCSDKNVYFWCCQSGLVIHNVYDLSEKWFKDYFLLESLNLRYFDLCTFHFATRVKFKALYIAKNKRFNVLWVALLLSLEPFLR